MSAPFGMTDKQFRDFSLIALIALAVFLWWRKRQAEKAAESGAPQAGAQSGSDPATIVFANNPNQFLPPQIGVTVNVPSAFGGQYTPLFGFVGIAQGEMLQ